MLGTGTLRQYIMLGMGTLRQHKLLLGTGTLRQQNMLGIGIDTMKCLPFSDVGSKRNVGWVGQIAFLYEVL